MEELSITTADSPILSNTSASFSAPDIRSSSQISIASSVITSPSVDSVLSQSASPRENVSFDIPTSSSQSPDTDPQILEALTEALGSKDRLYVLKLGEQMESMILERRPFIEVNPASSYQRMLAHRCSGYYKLAPETDSTTKIISVHFRSESRIPLRRIRELVPKEEIAQQPAFKIMVRANRDRGRSRYNSQPGSVAGEDADLSDVEQSETSSIGGRSNATGTSKRHLTIEEREAAYKEARSRIFMDFEEKEVEKEKDSSANSSTHSLVSGSGSTSGGRSSTGDADDSASSAATESEWSGPATNRREGWRGGSTTSSSRSTRLSDASYTKNGSGSSRNSRATSPSPVTYASVYDPMNSAAAYDPAYGNPYVPYYYPYAPQQGMAGQPYPAAPYYYQPYGYASPPHQPSPHHSDPTSPAATDNGYPQGQPPPMTGYPNYVWPHLPQGHQPPHMPPLQQGAHTVPPTPIQQPSSQGQQQPPLQVPYHQYMQPPFQYPIPYYTPFSPGQPVQQASHTPPHPQTHQYGPPDAINSVDGTQLGYANGSHHVDSNGNSRTSSRNSNNNHMGPNGNGRRGAPRTRQAWSYGPGASSTGFQYGGQGTEQVGPRLTTRRTSGTSSGSGSAGNRTPGDEASSTTQPALQSNDFPPLSSVTPEKRTPVVNSAWSNTVANRSIMSPGPPVGPSASASGNALVHYPNATNTDSPGSNNGSGMDESFERPSPKSAELFNPKGIARRGTLNRGPVDKENSRMGIEAERPRLIEAATISVLADRVGGISMDDCVDGAPAIAAHPANGPGGVESPLNVSSS
ncbi:hypothetical protein EUX98_g1672 [Antrodiella citrinella]|uniref:SUZ domain-containing protein n=1 Tax=Antrodiella citrinella TaxID=2447956 RepID=A0A4S4N989_9APHY|nr:hypothetical protein EUX98_g1672 [Antrodiella citrinella]